ncbi:RNA polymerase subunit sigma-70 [Streptomyces sp. NPDC012769]|uniref:RNA polymerase subunit sigma-70 n=1 Tax=Streptomyces sp. NPDC012769 TaxID=3364848 RepID=UPI0036A28B4D
MNEETFLTARFDAQEERLRAVARRMLGGCAEADEALAEARAEVGEGLREWLVTVVGRACVRRLQRRAGLEPPRAADPDGVDPVWLGLLVLLEGLERGERLAYVLHDLFGLSLDDTARITGGTPEEAGRRARSARLRVRGPGPGPGGDPARQRAAMERFLSAARARDPRALAAALHPEVVAHCAHGPVHGAGAVAERAAVALAGTAGTAGTIRPALVDGALGVVAFTAGRPVVAVALTLRDERITALDITTGEEGVRALELRFPDG